MAKAKYTAAQVQAQADALFAGFDPASIAKIVELLMGLLKVFLPLFMGIDPSKPSGKDKRWLKNLVGTASRLD
jgi:hypothetical protein